MSSLWPKTKNILLKNNNGKETLWNEFEYFKWLQWNEVDGPPQK